MKRNILKINKVMMNKILNLVISSTFIILTIFTPFSNTEAAINKQINYQGKLTNGSGMAVANGTYNMEFKLYNTVPSVVWTETRINANRVTVTNGLFSVMLGEVSSLSGVDFNQTLTLGVNIGGTAVTPTWDGEMTPRKSLGSVSAAIVAETVTGAAQTNITSLGTLTGLTVTGGSTLRGLTVDNATATYDRIGITAAATGAARFDGTITNADLTGARTWTLPNVSGTLITTGDSGTVTSAMIVAALTGKTYNGISLTANTTGFSVAGGTTSKTLTVNNSMTLAGTDGSTLNIGAGGTLGTGAFAAIGNYVPYTGATSNVDLGVHNLTVDTNSLFVDSVNHRVSIGTLTPEVGAKLQVNGVISSPDSGTRSERFGLGSSATNTFANVFGNGSSVTGGYSSAFGTDVVVNGNYSTAFGSQTTLNGDDSLVLGEASTVGSVAHGVSRSIALGTDNYIDASHVVALGGGINTNFANTFLVGSGTFATAANQVVVGANNLPKTDVFFGNGVYNATPSAYTIHGTSGNGTDIAGANINIAGGQGTGTGLGGSILFQTAGVGTTGAATNALATRVVIDSSGNVGVGIVGPGYKLDVNGDIQAVTNYRSSSNNIVLTDSSGTVFRGVRANAWADALSTRFFQVGTSGDNIAITTQNGVAANRTMISSASTQITSASYVSTNAPTGIFEVSNGTSGLFNVSSSGSVGIGTTSPTAVLHLKAGTATLNTAPLKFTSGTNLTTAETGAMEYDGTNLYFTPTGTTRRTVAYTDSSITGSALSVKSNATTGVMQIVGPTAGTTRVMTIPDANFTAARIDAAQTFTGTQTFSSTISGNISGSAATVTTAAQPNITSVGTLTSLTMGGTLAMGANNITSTGSLGATGARLTAGFFTDLTVTNAIAGSVTGSAGSATNATNATNTAITEDTTTAVAVYPTWVTANTGNLPQKTTSTKLSFIPSTGILTSTGFVGAFNGTMGATTPSTGAFTTLTSNSTTTIGNGSGVVTTIGNTGGAAAVNINVGTGNFALNGVAASTYTIGNAAQTGTITIGQSTATGILNLGTGTGATTVNIGTGITNAKIINIGNGAVANTIAIGSATATGVSITDNNWSVTSAGVGTLASLTLNGNLTLGSNTLTTTNTGVVTNLNADLFDGVNSTGFSRALTSSTFASSATTAAFVADLTSKGLFNYPSATIKGTWDYAGNNDISDTGFGAFELAGTALQTWSDGTNKTILAIRPTTGAAAGQVLIYNDQGAGYSPGWRQIWTDTTDGSTSGLDADLLDGHDTGYFQTALTNTPVYISGTQSIADTKSFSSNDTGGGYTSRAIELREVGLTTTTNSSNQNYSPAIGFHWGGLSQAILSMHSNGQFYMTNDGTSAGTGLATLNANISALTGLFATSVTTPKIIGGVLTTSSLVFQTTTASGAAGANIRFLVGNNGSVEAMTILNDGKVGINNNAPSEALDVTGNIETTGSMKFTNGFLFEQAVGSLTVKKGADEIMVFDEL